MEPANEHQVRSMSWGERIRSAGYNIKYRALSYLEESAPTAIIRNFQTAYLGGRSYEARADTLQTTNRAIYEDFRKVPWMTYRAAFPELATENGDGYVTDTGWGCMVRVGQMFAAHALMRFLKPTSKEQVAEILKLFSDYDDSEMFSIQNIVAVARRDYDLVAGKWYNPSQISYILVDLFRESQERRRFKGFDFLVLNNATLFYDQLVMKMTGRTSICGCKKLKVVCKDCYRLRQSLAVVLLARIGLDQPEKKYLKVLNKMMECKFFLGVLGGKPEKALYFIGRINDNYIYLDPHMVQSGVGHHNFQQSFDSYFCESFRSCRNSSIDPSIGVAFYLETLEDLDEFYDCMSRIKENDPEDFFIFSNLQTPEYMRNHEQKQEPEPSGFVDIHQSQ